MVPFFYWGRISFFTIFVILVQEYPPKKEEHRRAMFLFLGVWSGRLEKGFPLMLHACFIV